mmetsp:Transcript_1744/g.3663  ORF Transcript_1744/g.3663 Transcript_1744/m.3663 type:complete len:439 (+) Transcript_1744:206-1522(+)
MTSVPSPSTATPIQLKDTGIASYIEFPDDTFFMESLSQNSKFRPGVAYVPVQRFVNGVEESHIYEITPSEPNAKHVAGPIASPDGSTDVTVFGSCLDDNGILYLCAFNRNSIIALDLTRTNEADEGKKAVCHLEVPGLASPNDVALDNSTMDENTTTLYVVGGTLRNLCGLGFSNSAYGQVFKVELTPNDPPTVTTIVEDLNVLAGVEVLGNKVWIAQLYDIISQDKTDAASTKVEWDGTTKEDTVWMADNIDTYKSKDGQTLMLCPAYSTVSTFVAQNVMRRKTLFSSILFYYQISTSWMRGESIREALRDPEVSLSFSNTYISEGTAPAPVRLIFQSTRNDSNQAWHFEVDLEEARSKHAPRDICDREDKSKVLGQRHYFNEQVTHAAHLVTSSENGDGSTTKKGFVACVNFEQPRILLLEDSAFEAVMATSLNRL